MAEPARSSAAGPGAPGWGDVRRAMITAAQACAAAVTALAAAPADASALRMAELSAAMLGDLGDLARRWAFDDAVAEEERARAVAEDRASRPRSRRLRVLT